MSQHDQPQSNTLTATQSIDPLQADTAANTRATGDGALPEQLGEFRILGLLGRGGMGAVYLAEQQHPQREVALKVLRGAHDDAPSMTRPMGLQMSTEGGPSFDGGPAQDVIRLDSPSLISTGYKREIKSAAVVIDVNLASGTPLSAIGDYAALVLLAELDMPSDPPDRSILALFAPDAARPGGLTEQDDALLKALYALPMARDARFHRGKLIGGMTKAALGGAE